MTNRRDFLAGAGAALAFTAGCKTDPMGRSGRLFADFLSGPDLRFGVVSDLHVTTPKSCGLFAKSLRWFRNRGVDAVLIPGDLTDWGLKSGLGYVKRTWDSVFAGTDVVPLFCTGNHDLEGWSYGDMAVEMHANGYSESERMGPAGIASAWTEAFGEPFAKIRRRTVRGYDFISCEWGAYEALAGWMDDHAAELPEDRPFFYFQHPPITGTTPDSSYPADRRLVKPVLERHPNCIAFTGHAHRPFLDERSIWQEGFVSVSTPSLSYASWPAGHENGDAARNGTVAWGMPVEPARRDLRGGQGYLVEVWPDRVSVGRWDMEEGETDCAPWTVPLPVGAERPFDASRRAAAEPVPRFPEGAEIDFSTRNTENRQGHWMIAMNCEFPSAEMPSGHRVFDYEIRAVPQDGSEAVVKRFLSPAYAKMRKFEPCRQRFWFDVRELPQGVDYVLEVRARNCFGRCSEPLVTSVIRGTVVNSQKS